MAAFPAIVPTSRSFSPGVYPQRSYISLSGVVIKRTFGTTPSNAKMDLSFDNINDNSAAAIVEHYRNQTQLNKRFLLSSQVLAGMSETLSPYASSAYDGLWWEYAKPPKVDTVRPGRSSVSVSLSGEIRDPSRDN